VRQQSWMFGSRLEHDAHLAMRRCWRAWIAAFAIQDAGELEKLLASRHSAKHSWPSQDAKCTRSAYSLPARFHANRKDSDDVGDGGVVILTTESSLPRTRLPPAEHGKLTPEKPSKHRHTICMATPLQENRCTADARWHSASSPNLAQSFVCRQQVVPHAVVTARRPAIIAAGF
jgi:hypothetical protein